MSEPAIPVRLNRRTTMRNLSKMNGDNLLGLKRRKQSEYSHTMMSSYVAKNLILKKKVDQWYKEQTVTLNQLDRMQNGLFRNLLDLQRAKKRIEHDYIKKQQEEMKQHPASRTFPEITQKKTTTTTKPPTTKATSALPPEIAQPVSSVIKLPPLVPHPPPQPRPSQQQPPPVPAAPVMKEHTDGTDNSDDEDANAIIITPADISELLSDGEDDELSKLTPERLIRTRKSGVNAVHLNPYFSPAIPKRRPSKKAKAPPPEPIPVVPDEESSVGTPSTAATDPKPQQPEKPETLPPFTFMRKRITLLILDKQLNQLKNRKEFRDELTKDFTIYKRGKDGKLIGELGRPKDREFRIPSGSEEKTRKKIMQEVKADAEVHEKKIDSFFAELRKEGEAMKKVEKAKPVEKKKTMKLIQGGPSSLDAIMKVFTSGSQVDGTGPKYVRHYQMPTEEEAAIAKVTQRERRTSSWNAPKGAQQARPWTRLPP